MFWILLAVAAVISAIGFYKFIYFISLGYGFSIAGLGIAMLLGLRGSLSAGTAVACALFVIYGLRLGGYLLLREVKSASYRKTMKTEIKDGSSMSLFVQILIWVSCALLYVAEVSPVYFRLANAMGTDGWTAAGVVIMAGGIALEALADKQKSDAKKRDPRRFCDQGLFKMVRCPNYFGEVVFWSGVLVSGVSALRGFGQWALALLGYVGIVYIMFSGARRLEIRQNKNYGADPAYQAYVKKVPILIPLLPVYSVEKYTWLRG